MTNPTLTMYAIGVIGVIVGILAGMALVYAAMEDRYRDLAEDIKEDAEFKCLATIRKNYKKEQRTRKLLLHELGEALGVDVVHLPSFGYITLKKAMEIPEDIVEDCIGYENSETEDA